LVSTNITEPELWVYVVRTHLLSPPVSGSGDYPSLKFSSRLVEHSLVSSSSVLVRSSSPGKVSIQRPEGAHPARNNEERA
jgi:hypothetical protein